MASTPCRQPNRSASPPVIALTLQQHLEQNPRPPVFSADFIERRMREFNQDQARQKRQTAIAIIDEVRQALERNYAIR